MPHVFIVRTPKALLDVRGKLYELLTTCIPGDVILKTFMARLSIVFYIIIFHYTL